MTKIISDLLVAKEPLFSISLEQLERFSGRNNIDISLTAELLVKAKSKVRELGLDPRDTTDAELYQSLINLIQLHDQFLCRQFGGNDPANVVDMLPRIQTAIQRMNVPRTAWFLKESVAKKLLKAMPPKKVMKILGYRSFDSMVKRESIGSILAAARLIETEQWNTNFTAKYVTVRPSDFEIREIEIIHLDHKRWDKAAKLIDKIRNHSVVSVRELGIIVIFPLSVEKLAGITITVTAFILHAINEIRMYSAYFKLHQVQPDFGIRLVNSVARDSGHDFQVAGNDIHWRVVQQHFGRQGSIYHPEAFEPHLYYEDLNWRTVEESLYHIEPAIYYWNALRYVAIQGKDGKPISFNLMDMALNYVNQLPFEKRIYSHFAASLRNELHLRYLQISKIEEHVLRQIDDSLLDNEILMHSYKRRLV